MSLSTGKSTITTTGTTASTSYTAITPGQSFSVVVGVNGILDIDLFSRVVSDTAYVSMWMSFSLSGANTLNALDLNASMFQGFAPNAYGQVSRRVRLTGLTPGPTTVTAMFRVSGSSGNFLDRQISATAL